jgi:hypothetical protein
VSIQNRSFESKERNKCYYPPSSAGADAAIAADIYDEFVKKASELASSRKVGNPLLGGIEQGPIVSKVQFDKVMNYIKVGQEEGATISTGKLFSAGRTYILSAEFPKLSHRFCCCRVLHRYAN